MRSKSMRVPSLSKIIACGLKFLSKYIYLSTLDKKSHGLARGYVYTIVSRNLARLIRIAPPVKCCRKPCHARQHDKNIAMHTNQTPSRACCATEQRRYCPWEPVAP